MLFAKINSKTLKRNLSRVICLTRSLTRIWSHWVVALQERQPGLFLLLLIEFLPLFSGMLCPSPNNKDRHLRIKMSNLCPLCAKILSTNMRQVRFGRRWGLAVGHHWFLSQAGKKPLSWRKGESWRRLERVRFQNRGPYTLLPRLS